MFITIVVAIILGFVVIFAMKKVPAPVSQEQQEAGLGMDRRPCHRPSLSNVLNGCAAHYYRSWA